ncbi:type II toxin-antitoxin system HicB family antitoxin [soil metagenome]
MIILMLGTDILSDYLGRALAQAEYDKLEDGTFFGKIPSCKGVVAFGSTLRECESELHSTLEDCVLVGLKLGHELPLIGNMNLITMPTYEPVECV